MKVYALVTTLGLLFTGCSSTQKVLSNYPVDVGDILNQVNSAILFAKAENKNEALPEISSVQLDLQVGTSSAVSGSLPVSLVTAEGTVEHENIQQISLTFAASGKLTDDEVKQMKATELSSAIETIYKSVSHANDAFQFQKGSSKLQCTFKRDLNAAIKRLLIIPIQIGASHSHELVQTITLNFEAQSAVSAHPPSSAAVDPL